MLGGKTDGHGKIDTSQQSAPGRKYLDAETRSHEEPSSSIHHHSAGLGIDNGLLIEFSLKTLHLPEAKHRLWRSAALLLAALLRVVFLFSLSRLSFLENRYPTVSGFPTGGSARLPIA